MSGRVRALYTQSWSSRHRGGVVFVCDRGKCFSCHRSRCRRGLVGLLHSQLPSPETASSFPSGTSPQVDTATHPFEGLLGCLPQPFTVDDCWALCSLRCAWLCPPCGPAGRSTTWSRRWQRARRLWGWTKTRWRRSATLWNIGFLRRWRQHFCRGRRRTPWLLSCPAGIESCFGK